MVFTLRIMINMKKIFFIKNSVQYKIIMIMIEKILNTKKAFI